MKHLTKREAVLLSAFAANPSMSSETGIGWQFIKATIMAVSDSQIHVVAIMNQRSAVVVREELARLGLAERVTVVGIDMPARLKWLLKPQLTRLEYLVWNSIAMKRVKELESEFDFVLAHHVTFATEMFPTPITACSRQTYKVWGPVGSAGDPDVYRVGPASVASRREEKLQRVRDVLVNIPMFFVGRRVDLVLAQNGRVSAAFEALNIDVEVFPNVVIKEDLQREIDSIAEGVDSDWSTDSHRPLRILAVGHLVARKRFELGIAALTSDLLGNSSLHLIGRPLQGHPDYLPDLASSAGVQERVKFLGWLPRPEVLRCMAECDVLFHPSGREGASGVVGEATAMGIPVVCFENTGASSVLDDAGVPGIKIDAGGRPSAEDLATAIRAASVLPRPRSRVWDERRFEALQSRLLAEATSRRSDNSSQITKSGRRRTLFGLLS